MDPAVDLDAEITDKKAVDKKGLVKKTITKTKAARLLRGRPPFFLDSPRGHRYHSVGIYMLYFLDFYVLHIYMYHMY